MLGLSLPAALAMGVLLGNMPVLAVGLFGFCVVSIWLLIRPPSQPVIRREITAASVSVGEVTTVAWEVRVAEGMGPVFVYDALPEALDVASGTNFRLFWKGYRAATFANSYTVRCNQRGRHEIAPTAWETRHPVDFYQPRAGSAAEALEIKVFPRLSAIRRISRTRGVSRLPIPSGDAGRTGVVTTDFREIRAYAPGDAVRAINWKATARRSAAGAGRPLVNEYEPEGKQAVWLFLDSSRHMAVGTSRENPLEHAVEAASAVAHYYLSRGYYVGAHFSSRPDDVIYADTGKRQFYRLSREMLRVRPAGFYYDLRRAAQVCRSQLTRYRPRCVVFTRLDAGFSETRRGATAVRKLLEGTTALLSFSPGRRRRIAVSVVAISGRYYAPEDAPFSELTAALRAMETRPAVRQLQRRGAGVVEWNPFRQPLSEAFFRDLAARRAAR